MLLQSEKPLETVCRKWVSERDYDLSEGFERALRNPEYLEDLDEMERDIDTPAVR